MLSPAYLLLPLFVIFSFTFTVVHAHGYVHSVTLDGTTYQGADPYGSAISSPIHQVSSNSPATPVYGDIKGVVMACGGDAKAASMTVPMTAGSDWPHNVGPIITYLGKCDGPCATTDPTMINFSKIHRVDFVPGTHIWVQSQTLYKGLPFNFTLPGDLPNGDFIMRHEVIALLTVNCGSGKIPAATAKFPGAYSATDPGILMNVYDDPNNLVYRLPGPVLALEEDSEEDDNDDPPNTSDFVNLFFGVGNIHRLGCLFCNVRCHFVNCIRRVDLQFLIFVAFFFVLGFGFAFYHVCSIDYNLSFDFGFSIHYTHYDRFCIDSNDFDFRCVDYVSGDLHNGQKDQDKATDNYHFAPTKYFVQLYFIRKLDYVDHILVRP
ncbi:hypothetical protein FS837_003647 [Tulasnella sp. UAMH 9824]|nr:hypothetical protein FS837_003647 [Tulasnella sp. UAMH 9824]